MIKTIVVKYKISAEEGKNEVKQSHYRTGQAVRVAGG
jgi:hypothetical protein